MACWPGCGTRASNSWLPSACARRPRPRAGAPMSPHQRRHLMPSIDARAPQVEPSSALAAARSRDPHRLPVTRDLTLAHLAAILVALGIMVASGVGLTAGAGGLYGDSSLVLVSQGGDVANLVLVLPIL